MDELGSSHEIVSLAQLAEYYGFKEDDILRGLHERIQTAYLKLGGDESGEDLIHLLTLYHDTAAQMVEGQELDTVPRMCAQIGLIIREAFLAKETFHEDFYRQKIDEALEYAYQISDFEEEGYRILRRLIGSANNSSC